MWSGKPSLWAYQCSWLIKSFVTLIYSGIMVGNDIFWYWIRPWSLFQSCLFPLSSFLDGTASLTAPSSALERKRLHPQPLSLLPLSEPEYPLDCSHQLHKPSLKIPTDGSTCSSHHTGSKPCRASYGSAQLWQTALRNQVRWWLRGG